MSDSDLLGKGEGRMKAVLRTSHGERDSRFENEITDARTGTVMLDVLGTK